MFLRKPTFKRFEYIPRYYDPSKDESNRRRRRIKFERKVRRGDHRSLFVVIALFIIILLILSFLN